jgi:hypothetical protein
MLQQRVNALFVAADEFLQRPARSTVAKSAPAHDRFSLAAATELIE